LYQADPGTQRMKEGINRTVSISLQNNITCSSIRDVKKSCGQIIMPFFHPFQIKSQ
jgi:hypothetical protein